jgi:alkylation response protein AidB-like acyl-CoA dehydrogenase
METVLSLTTRYLKERHQFGRPLGSFQALKFRVADMHVALEQARSMTLWASMVLQDCAGDQARTQEAVAHAKVQVARASRLVGQSAVQLHGGIGLTSEHPIGHYHAHLVALSQLFGSEEHYLGLLMSSLSGHQHIDVLE